MSDSDNTVDAVEAPAHHMELTTEIVSAYVSRNHLQPTELAALISSVHAALGNLSKAAEPAGLAFEKPTSAQIRKSITPDALISFLDGKPYKTLKRHLTKHGLDMAGYRERFGLPYDYPATAASYSEARSALARNLGLGRKLKAAPAQASAAETVSARAEADLLGQRGALSSVVWRDHRVVTRQTEALAVAARIQEMAAQMTLERFVALAVNEAHQPVWRDAFADLSRGRLLHLLNRWRCSGAGGDAGQRSVNARNQSRKVSGQEPGCWRRRQQRRYLRAR